MKSRTDKLSGMKRNSHIKKIARLWAFLVSMFTLYIILFSISSTRVVTALKISGSILLQIAIPLLIAFITMVVLNFFSGHEKISRLFGRGQGIRGIAFSSLAGILSMGPVYAWYPLLKGLREKNVSDFHLANFLSNRAIKPFLFPVMVFYFGWIYTLILNIMILMASLLTAKIVSIAGERRTQTDQ
jgi:uncharacterized membrane protein YraQ (UPF0718 family)